MSDGWIVIVVVQGEVGEKERNIMIDAEGLKSVKKYLKVAVLEGGEVLEGGWNGG